MVKVFDYSDPKRGWIEFPDYKSAEIFVLNTLDSYWMMDSDNCWTAYMEIYNDDKYVVWCGEFGAWLGSGESLPYKNIYYGSRKEFAGSVKFTELNPNKDYIIV